MIIDWRQNDSFPHCPFAQHVKLVSLIITIENGHSEWYTYI